MKKFLVVVLLLVLAASGASLFTTGRAHAQTIPTYTFDNSLIVQHAIDMMRSLHTVDKTGKPIIKPYKSGYDGDCWPFVRDMLMKEGVLNIDNTGPANTDYFAHLTGAGGVEKPLTELQPGDIVQEGPNGGHTYIIVGFIDREWYYVIDSNSDWTGSGPYIDKVKEYARQVLSTNDGGTKAFQFGVTKDIYSTSYAEFASTLVQWDGDTNPQRASWVVSPWLQRYWIPDTNTYGCLRGQHWDMGGQPIALPAATLDKLPDQWGVHAACDGNRLYQNQVLLRGGYLNSQNHKFQLTFHDDGNITFSGLHGVLWSTKSSAAFMGYDRLEMQSDGNLVAYSVRDGIKPWASNTSGKTMISYLEVTNDGHLLLYDVHHGAIDVITKAVTPAPRGAVYGFGIMSMMNREGRKLPSMMLTPVSTSRGAHVVLQAWVPIKNHNAIPMQTWSQKEIVADGVTYTEFVNGQTGMVLSVAAASKNYGAPLVQWVDHNGLDQQWTITHLADTYEQFTNRNSGLVMDVYHSRDASGAAVVQWTNNMTPNQQWIN